MKKVHSKADKATEPKPEPFLHFRLEIVGEMANVEVHGRVGSIISSVISVMHAKPEIASLLITAAYQFVEENELVINPVNTKK